MSAAKTTGDPWGVCLCAGDSKSFLSARLAAEREQAVEREEKESTGGVQVVAVESWRGIREQ
jgi:hypothetical protein